MSVSRANLKFIAGYTVLVGLPIVGLLQVLRIGQGLSAPAPAVSVGLHEPAANGGSVLASDLSILILQVVIVLALSRLAAAILTRLYQPRVVGEMLAGILLGPSLLGWIAPRLSSFLFPGTSLPYLGALSQVGLIIFMFLVGLEVDVRELKGRGHAAILTSHVSISLPFFLAVMLSLFLYPRLATGGVSFPSFALFLGAAMSVTAFPVLARILMERGMLRSRLGTVAIACAAVDDVTGWWILAFIVLKVRAAQSAVPLWITVTGVVGFVLVMVLGVRPLAKRLVRRFSEPELHAERILTPVLLLVFLSALSTDALGVHRLLGAFLAGSIMPKEQRFVAFVRDRFHTVTVTLFLPLFFAYTGLRTDLAMVKGPIMWLYCSVIVVVAIVGKLGGSTLAAWLSGMRIRDALGLGSLLNTRGLMELVILNIGLDIGVISRTLFSMMVFMAVFTTVMTTPLLQIVLPKNQASREGEADAVTTDLDS